MYSDFAWKIPDKCERADASEAFVLIIVHLKQIGVALMETAEAIRWHSTFFNLNEKV
jgi:hypothetical protein